MGVLMTRFAGLSILLFLGSTATLASAAPADTKPYWVSIDQPEARMRTGPSTEFPVKWVYKRKNLPVKVIMKHSVWRKIEDPDGDQGWIHVRLLSPDRSAIVLDSVADMRDEPHSGARISWRAEPGVVGHISECEKGWCLFDVSGRRGYVRASQLWGDEELAAH